jgi:hypothetical protein
MAFVVDEFALHSPAQQLLDRFLIGYRRDGHFHRLEGCQVCLFGAMERTHPEVERRIKDFGLRVAEDMESAVAAADGVIVVWRGSGAKANDDLLRTTLQRMRSGAACFVHGTLANGIATATEFAGLAKARGVSLCAGTSAAVTFRLPDVDLKPGTRLSEAMIVVQGAFPEAELDALEGLLPILQRRRKGEAGVAGIRRLENDELWRAEQEGSWSWSLLAAALSRSNTVQGDPVKDGRTQDIAGLGVVKSLAKHPRGWLLKHRDGLRTALLVLDGAVADCNFAVRLADGGTVSAQLYRPPEPAQEQFSRLAMMIEDFFRTGKAPWTVERCLLIAQLLEEFTQRQR